jgi:hypothetical protein
MKLTQYFLRQTVCAITISSFSVITVSAAKTTLPVLDTAQALQLAAAIVETPLACIAEHQWHEKTKKALVLKLLTAVTRLSQVGLFMYNNPNDTHNIIHNLYLGTDDVVNLFSFGLDLKTFDSKNQQNLQNSSQEVGKQLYRKSRMALATIEGLAAIASSIIPTADNLNLNHNLERASYRNKALAVSVLCRSLSEWLKTEHGSNKAGFMLSLLIINTIHSLYDFSKNPTDYINQSFSDREQRRQKQNLKPSDQISQDNVIFQLNNIKQFASIDQGDTRTCGRYAAFNGIKMLHGALAESPSNMQNQEEFALFNQELDSINIPLENLATGDIEKLIKKHENISNIKNVSVIEYTTISSNVQNPLTFFNRHKETIEKIGFFRQSQEPHLIILNPTGDQGHWISMVIIPKTKESWVADSWQNQNQTNSDATNFVYNLFMNQELPIPEQIKFLKQQEKQSSKPIADSISLD